MALKEYWYATPYAQFSIADLIEGASKAGSSALPASIEAVPAPNRFIPTNLKMKAPLVTSDAQRRAPPGKLPYESSTWDVYFKQDKTFGKPKGYVFALMATPGATETADAVVLSKLWKTSLVDRLGSFVYDAALAGLGYEVDVTARGLRFSCFGYDERLPEFVETIAQAIATHDPATIDNAEATFARQKELLQRELEQFDTQQPYQHCRYWESLCVETPKVRACTCTYQRWYFVPHCHAAYIPTLVLCTVSPCHVHVLSIATARWHSGVFCHDAFCETATTFVALRLGVLVFAGRCLT